MVTYVRAVLLLFVSFVCSVTCSVSDCKFTNSKGKVFDLSPLISKECQLSFFWKDSPSFRCSVLLYFFWLLMSFFLIIALTACCFDIAYQWNQTLWNTANNMVTNTDFADKVNVMLQVQVCRNITKPIMPEACNVSAPAYMYNVDDKSCVALGKLFVATFVEAPFGDGLYLNMFYGDAMTHIDHYQLKLYFICKEGVTMDGPKLEHIKDDYDAHIKIFTKYAC